MTDRAKKRENEARYREKNREKIRERSKQYREENKELLRERYKLYSKTYRERHPERFRAAKERYNNTEKGVISKRKYLLRKCYGLTIEEYDAMMEKQGHRCAACGSPETRGTNWHVDHDHVTGKVREILCLSCNITLGQVNDSADHLRKLAAYLEKHSGKN
jgi:hypothetical protein